MIPAVTVSPKIMHGTPCFAGTRVPVEILFDYLAEGHALDYFLHEFPTVSRQQAEQVLEEAKARAVDAAKAASAA